MAMRGPMRNELFKYRKRKKVSLDGSVPGIPHSSFGRSRRHVSGMPYRPGSSGYNHGSYTGGIPRAYNPRLNSPGVDWGEYNSHESSHTSFARTPPIRTGPSHNLTGNMPGMLNVPTDDLAMDELWSMMRGTSSRPQEGPIPVDFEDIRHLIDGVRTTLNPPSEVEANSLIKLNDVNNALNTLRDSLPSDHPDIVNLKLASNILSGDGVPTQEELVSDDYFDTETELAQMIDPDDLQSLLYSMENEENPVHADLGDVTEALWFLENRLPHDHPDILNLKQALLQLGRQKDHQMRQDPRFWEIYDSIDDSSQSNLGPGNPYENDELIGAQMSESSVEHNDYDARLMQEANDLEQQLFADETPGVTEFQEAMTSEPMLEDMVEQEFASLGSGPPAMETIEQQALSGLPMKIANAGESEQFMGMNVFDTNPAFDEINQAIDQAAAFQQPQPDPWKMQDDPYQQMSMMMNMQKRYMADPFAMPGQMGPGYGPMPDAMMGPM